MNPLNYASLEAAKRLYDAGIVLETDIVRVVYCNGQEILCPSSFVHCPPVDPLQIKTIYRTPSMAEVLRELPEEYCNTASDPILTFTMTKTHIGYTGGKGQGFMFPICVDEHGSARRNTNFTNALIDLLIWVKP